MCRAYKSRFQFRGAEGLGNPLYWLVMTRMCLAINKWRVAEVTKNFYCELMKLAQEDDITFNHDTDLLGNVLNHDH